MSVQARKNKNGTMSYVARVRDQTGRQANRVFPKRADAKKWEAQKLLEFAAGGSARAPAPKLTVDAFVKDWQEGQIHLRRSSLANDASIIKVHILPTWEGVPITKVHFMIVQKWVASLSDVRKPSTVVKIFSTFNKIMKDALRAQVITLNPCDGVRLPKIERVEPDIPTPEQVARFIDAIDARYRAWATTAAYSGMRFGELAGLRWGRINVLRRRIEVVESAYQLPSGEIVFNDYLKTSAGRRVVPVPQIVLDALGAPQAPDDLVFTRPEGGPLARSPFRERFFVPAREAADLPNLTPHHLRHYAISLWVSTTGDLVKAKTWAGQSQLRMLDVYAHFLPDDERDDLMVEKFDAIARNAASGQAG